MWGPDGSLYYPGTLSPWCRERLNWITPRTISSSDVYAIGTAQLAGDVYRIDLSPGEYLLIENRQKLFMDAILPGDGGLLIWHIDENMGNDWLSRPGWPLQPGWPGNGNHYMIALLSPDTRYDMERDTNYGDETDFWTSAFSLEPGPGSRTVDVGQISRYPNTDSYSGGNIQQTGIRIFDISANGNYMTFKAQFPGSPFPDSFSMKEDPTDPPTDGPTFAPTDFPTEPPTVSPTDSPTSSPTVSPSASPTERPTPFPTRSPSVSPSALPSETPPGTYEYEEKKIIIRKPFESYYGNNR